MDPRFEPGQTFAYKRECDRYRPVYYAAASGDFNPIHIDPEVGQQAGLDGVILHGMCTLAWCVDAAVRFVGDPGKIRRVRARFSRPVRLGDEIQLNGKVHSVEGHTARLDVSAKNQRGEDVLKAAVVEVDVS
jgi:3-hydroxybutyryl-CoA dehydratase